MNTIRYAMIQAFVEQTLHWLTLYRSSRFMHYRKTAIGFGSAPLQQNG